MTGQGLPYLTTAELGTVLPAVDALDAAWANARDETRESPPRVVLPVKGTAPGSDGEMLLMPAFGPEGAGTKLVTIAPANPQRRLPMIQGLYVLFAPGSLTPELLIEGGALTKLRTAAVSALATRYLAREDSCRLVVFGAGVQAGGHIEAMRAVRPIESVQIVGSSPTSARAHELVAELRDVGDRGEHRRPRRGRARRRGLHMHDERHARVRWPLPPSRRSCQRRWGLPSRHSRARRRGIETRDGGRRDARCGADRGGRRVIQAIAAGLLPQRGFAHELSEVINGRPDEAGITVFKSVGLASEDLLLARAAAEGLR